MRISQKVKGVLIVKSSTYYFHVKTKIFADFQIRISIPLIDCEFLARMAIHLWIGAHEFSTS